jgi:hypothetical protein
VKTSKLRAMVISGAMAALALTLPVAFHAVGLGSKFLPMLLPLLLNGFLVPVPWAVFTGAVVPPVSGLLTGMPPLYPPVALIMSSEGAILGGMAAGVYRVTRPRIWPALVVAVVSGRAASLALTWWLAGTLGLPPSLASLATFVQALPGVALQLAVVPIVVRALSRRKGILFGYEHNHKASPLQ